MSAAADGYSQKQGVLLLALIMAVTVTLSLVTVPLGQVADPVRKSFGIDDVQFSFLLGALFAVPSMIMTVAGGWLADRISRRRLLLAAMILWTGGALWSAFARSYYELAAARLIVASAAGIKFPLVMTWVSDAYPAERRGRAIGAIFVFIGIGPAIGGLLSGMVLHAAQQGTFAALPGLGALEPWRLALGLLASSNVLVAPWVLLFPDDRQRLSREKEQTCPHEAAPLYPHWLIGAVILAMALLTLADNANLGWLPTVLSRQHRFDAQQVGFAFGLVVTLAGLLGPLLGGGLDEWVYRRRGTSGRIAVCAIATLCCAPLLSLFLAAPAEWFIGALIVNGVLTMLATTVGFVALQSLLPPARRGVGIGVAQALSNLAAASAPTLVAFVSTQMPVSSTSIGHGVSVVTFVAFIGAAVFCALSAWSLNPKAPRPPEKDAYSLLDERYTE